MRPIYLLLSLFPAIVFLLCAVFINYQDGYYYYQESGKYLVNYLEDKPILLKLFDYRANDAEFYRPRELGNVFNLIDAYLLLGSTRLGFVHFLSIWHFITMFCIAISPFIYIVYKKTTDKMMYFLVICLGLLFLSSTAPFFTTFYFRNSKQSVSLVATIFFWIIWLVYKTKLKASTLSGVIVFSLTFSLGIIDETGIVLASLFVGYLFLAWLTSIRSRLQNILFISSLLGMVSIWVYRQIISPSIVKSVLGFSPEKWGQIQSIPDILTVVNGGKDLLLHYIGSLHRAVPNQMIVFLILAVSLLLTHSFIDHFLNRFSKNYILKIFSTGVFVVVFFGGITYALGIMGILFPALYMEHVLLVYYPLPFVTIWFLLITYSILYLVKKVPKSRYVFLSILPVVVIINIISLPRYHNVLRNQWKIHEFYGLAFPLIEAVKKDKLYKKDILNMPSHEILYILREHLGKPIIEEE